LSVFHYLFNNQVPEQMNDDNDIEVIAANLKQQVDSLNLLFDSLKKESVLANPLLLEQVYVAEYQELKKRIQTLIEVVIDTHSELLSQLLSLNDKVDDIYNRHMSSFPHIANSNNNNNNMGDESVEKSNDPTRKVADYNHLDVSETKLSLTTTSLQRMEDEATKTKNTKLVEFSNDNDTKISAVKGDEHSNAATDSDSDSDRDDDDDSDNDKNDENGEEENANEPFTCPICDESKPRREGYAFEHCQHIYCIECLQAYFNTKISERKVLEIRCPHPKCDTQVSYYDVQRVVPLESFSKYEEFTLLAALSQDPNCRWCPRPGCGNAVIGDPQYRRIVCNKCQFEFCFECNDSWHTGTCEEYRQWKVENGKADVKFEEWQKENTKPCPNCKTRIQKNEGCNHMTCTNCHYEFCWLCGAKYTPRHYDLYNVFGCPGLQTAKADRMGVGKRIGVRIAVGTGLVLGGAVCLALAVPALIIGGPIYGAIKLHQRRKRRQLRKRRYSRRYFY
jgi:ariadne-1